MSVYEVEVIVKEVYKEEARDSDTAKILAGDPTFSIIKNVERVKSNAVLIENSEDHSKEKRQKIEMKNRKPTNGDLFTMKRFKKMVESGGISDYDGVGVYSDGVYEYHVIHTVENLDKSYTHVMWYNR